MFSLRSKASLVEGVPESPFPFVVADLSLVFSFVLKYAFDSAR
jgi:hypothetical protein